jgi:hypothetical protein
VGAGLSADFPIGSGLTVMVDHVGDAFIATMIERN